MLKKNHVILIAHTKMKINSPFTMDARSECVTCSACHASLEKRPQRCATDLAVSARSSCDITRVGGSGQVLTCFDINPAASDDVGAGRERGTIARLCVRVVGGGRRELDERAEDVREVPGEVIVGHVPSERRHPQRRFITFSRQPCLVGGGRPRARRREGWGAWT